MVLANGDVAVATSRDSAALDFSRDGATARNFLKLDLDVNCKESVDRAFAKALAVFGTVDVVGEHCCQFAVIKVLTSISQQRWFWAAWGV